MGFGCQNFLVTKPDQKPRTLITHSSINPFPPGWSTRHTGAQLGVRGRKAERRGQEQLQPSALWGAHPHPRACVPGNQPEPERGVEVIYPACHLLPCRPLPGFTKQSSLSQGPSCCPASMGASLAPVLGTGTRGPAHFGTEMGTDVALRGLGFQRDLHSRGLQALGEGRCRV